MMKSIQYNCCSFVQKTFSLVLLSNYIICSLKLSNRTRAERDESIVEDREMLVTKLKSLGADLMHSAEFNDREMTETLLLEVKDVWGRITNQSINMPIFISVDDDIINLDDLMHYTARLLFLSKDRHCESPLETFFKNQCLPIRNIENCPENMELYDGPNNEGFCDCSDVKGNNSLRMIYWDQTGECYFQNTQGPCDVGQWFVLKNVPICELIPEGCPADGEHVYGNIGTSKRLLRGSKCWKIGNPCSKLNRLSSSAPSDMKIIQVEQSEDGNLHLFCDVKKIYGRAKAESSVGFNPPCSPGTYRSRFEKCTRGFFG